MPIRYLALSGAISAPPPVRTAPPRWPLMLLAGAAMLGAGVLVAGIAILLKTYLPTLFGGA